MEHKKPLIAVVEDDPDILELLDINLSNSGFSVVTFPMAAKFFDFLKKKQPDLVVLDLMLPDVNGIEICKTLKSDRNYAHIPLVMLTARGEETDIVLGLELGADDYMAKPFSTKELTARIKAVLRRFSRPAAPDSEVIELNRDFVIHLNRHEVRVAGRKINLTKTEFTILSTLAERPGWVFSREKLLARLWGNEKFIIDRTVDVHIKNLRDKLGDYGKFIINVRGVGYKLEL